jgi:hypothetical protein
VVFTLGASVSVSGCLVFIIRPFSLNPSTACSFLVFQNVHNGNRGHRHTTRLKVTYRRLPPHHDNWSGALVTAICKLFFLLSMSSKFWNIRTYCENGIKYNFEGGKCSPSPTMSTKSYRALLTAQKGKFGFSAAGIHVKTVC